ncbi:MAG: hypothetical protein PHF84_07535 [bacterium]|nr:hypothetical protein [bacterium]
MNLFQLVKPIGITTYAFIFLTVLSGLLRWKLNVHKFLALSALVLGTTHAVIVIFF